MSLGSAYKSISANNIDGLYAPVNYLSNGSAESINDGASTNFTWNVFTTTMTSGLPTGTVTLGAGNPVLSFSTTQPLNGTQSWNLAASAGLAAGTGFISPVFTINREDQAKVLSGKFSYEVFSGLANLNLSGVLGSQTIGVYMYDVDNSAWVQPNGMLGMIQGSGPAVCGPITFQTNPAGSGSRYQMAIIFLQAPAGACVIKFDSFVLGPQAIMSSPAMTDWVAYTPTITGFGTPTGVNFKSRRAGDSLEVMGYFTSGTSTAVTAQIGLGFNGAAGNVVLDTSKAPTYSVMGAGSINVSGSTFFSIAPISPGSNQSYVNIGLQNSTTSEIAGAAIANSMIGSGQAMSLAFTVPIVGWSSNSVQSSDASLNTVRATMNLITASQSIGTTLTKVAFNNVVVDKTGIAQIANSRFVVGVSGSYTLSPTLTVNQTTALGTLLFQLWKNGSAIRSLDPTLNTNYNGTITASWDDDAVAGDYYELWLNTSNNTVNVLSTAAIVGGSSFDIKKIGGTPIVQATESVNGSYTGSSSTLTTSFANMTFTTKEKDTHGIFNGTTLTANRPGSIQINTGFTVAPSATTPVLEIQLLKNGTQARYRAAPGSTNYASLEINTVIPVVTGDTIVLQAKTSAAATAVGAGCDFSWVYVGN